MLDDTEVTIATTAATLIVVVLAAMFWKPALTWAVFGLIWFGQQVGA